MSKSNYKYQNKHRQSNYYNKVNTSIESFEIESKNYGFPGFTLYFPKAPSSEVQKLLNFVEACSHFIKRNSSYKPEEIETNKYFSIDYKALIKDEKFLSEWSSFLEDLQSNTEYCLNCFGLAMHQYLTQNLNYSNSKEFFIPAINARLVNYEPIMAIKDLKVVCYGKLVSVRGTVIKASSVKIICQYMTFQCGTCRQFQIVKQSDGIYTIPNKCLTKQCRAQSNFLPIQSCKNTKTVKWQSIKIQEMIGNEQEENSRIPRTLQCELTEDLVQSCIPGDDVTITGIIKVKNEEVNSKNKQNSVFSMYLKAVSVVNNKNHSDGSYGASERITFNMDDYYTIQKIHSEPKLFRYLVQSLCPNIYGHELVKAGLLLSLFGGTKNENTRAESHILIVGDPGLGKSQLLRACTNVAPRGVYVCGSTSTNSGLTVTMTRESSAEFALEAGALLLADQGCCCIDEFDKMTAQHACLLEAMEQQTISIAKAGTVCTLPTRTTVLAAANPVGGHYNKAKTIAENLKISSPMLSRFDLIFIILDLPNEHLDNLLSKHVLALHSKTKLNTSYYNLSSSDSSSLKDKLKLSPGEEVEYLPHAMFRKYIAYAQKYVHPQLCSEAKTVLKQYYLGLRKQFRDGDCTPVTTRQLNSLIRLTQARAKAELREVASQEDALEVIEIMKNSLLDIFTDSSGNLDCSRSMNGAGISKKNKVMLLLRLLRSRSESLSKSLFHYNEIKEMANEMGIGDKFSNIFNNLNMQGYLLSKGNNMYQLVVADF